MIEPGQICRDLTRLRFSVGIVLGASKKAGKLLVCQWRSSPDGGGYWSAPRAMFEHQLEPLSPDFDFTSRRGLLAAAARRSIVNGLVRWQVGGPGLADRLTEVHHVGTVRP